MLKAIGFPAAMVVATAAALVLGNTGAFAYATGSIGYDISYLQCGSYQTAVRLSAPPVTSSQPSSSRFVTRWSPPQTGTPPTRFSVGRIWFNAPARFGIIGVDSGRPFISIQSPGNPCLANEYRHAPKGSLYVNTGYDPSYTDTNHTTSSCSTQSVAISGSAAQQAAWAVGCSEAQGDYTYASGQGITSPVSWWLDVETANSWCGQPGTACTDKSLNQYTIQGLIDTFTHIGAVPVGIYSNQGLWTAIVGNLPVTGATSDWVASGTSSAQQAATYCSNTYSFSGAPVSLVQFLGSFDRDYAC
jgi:hypothetical protein